MDEATGLFCDNQSSIKLARNPEFHKRSKHIAVKHHYIRELQQDSVINIQYIPTVEQKADIFTKPLPVGTFEGLRSRLGMDTIECMNE